MLAIFQRRRSEAVLRHTSSKIAIKEHLMHRMIATIALVLTCSLGACTTAPKTEAGKADKRAEAAVALTKAERNDPTLAPVLRDAKGYAVFPTVGKGAVGVGGAYGRGVLYEGGVVTGYCDLTQGSIGFQLGGQAYSQIIAFSTAEALNLFKTGNFAFDAQATAVALRSGAGANAKYSKGVAVFTMDESGLMFEASVGGQKFSYQAK
jgi:lipid-binding SYLF domain-containing protein